MAEGHKVIVKSTPKRIHKNTSSSSLSNIKQPNDVHQQLKSMRSDSAALTDGTTVDTENSITNMTQDQRNEQAATLLNETRIRRRLVGKIPSRCVWFIWFVSVMQICSFIAELVMNWYTIGTVIETKLSINPLFGPNPFVLIKMGACYPPCMHKLKDNPEITRINYRCPNTTAFKKVNCTFIDLFCGFNGISGTSNQWYRSILPIFLHAGIIHIGMNLFCQLILGVQMERRIGALRFAIIYLAAGIFGFVLSGNFGPDGAPRIGCSGSVFGILALYHLDFYYNWKKMEKPWVRFIILLVEIIFNFLLGLLPGIDNFSHVGGFFIGLLLGLTLIDSPENLRQHKKGKEYDKSSRKYRTFFYNRQKNWWIWFSLRAITFITVILIFVLLIVNFYTHKVTCNWCKYISCLPIKNWCDVGRLAKINTTALNAPQQTKLT